MNLKTALRPTRTRAAALAAAASAAALTLALTTPADAAKAQTPTAQTKPTVVLVHGAFADASSWNGVIKRLQHDGYQVIAPANPLRGLASDAASIHSLLAGIHGPVILAGHSYGGAVITEAATDAPNVKALVYIAAFTPDKGESALELSNKYPGSTLAATLNPIPFTQPDGTTGTDLYIKPDKFHDQFAADVPRHTTDLMAATQRPVTTTALEEKTTTTAWKTIPSWDLITTQDKNIPPAAQRYMAHRAHAHTTEINASHAVSVSHPTTVTHIIEQAAHATTH